MSTVTVDALPERYRDRIVVDPASNCWIWTGANDTKGYGRAKYQGYTHRIHRLTFQLLVGGLDPALVLDHLCRRTLCCNPEHMEQVTQAENARRVGLPTPDQPRTHCRHGHEYTAENTYLMPRGGRDCRACKLQRNRKCRAEM